MGADRITDPFDDPSFRPGASALPQMPQQMPQQQQDTGIRIIDPFDNPNFRPGQLPALPPGSGRGDGTSLTMPGANVIPYDPNDPDRDKVGGSAGVLTTLKAGMVPETDLENQQKRIKIFSQGMGIPESRFFYDNDGNALYVGDDGQVHMAVPTIRGGTVKQPVDLARRVGGQVGINVGPTLPAVAGGAAAMVGGPLLGAAVGGATDAVRQVAGNYFAGAPLDDIRYGNSAWQAAGVGAGEVAGQVGSALVQRARNPINPYNLRDGEIRQLIEALPQARERARVLQEHGMQATPYDLTDLDFLQRLEVTVNKQPGPVGDYMRRYYDQRSEMSFPNGVAQLFKRISPEGTPLVGWDKLQQGAQNTIAFLQNNATRAGNAGGWQEAIGSGARPDVRQVVADIRARIGHTSGVTREQLEKLLGELYTPTRGGQPGTGTLVTDFEKLHNVRLDLEGTLDGLRTTLPPSERGRLSEVLDPIYNDLNAALETAHASYGKGTLEYQLQQSHVAELRNGILTLMSKDPRVHEKLGDALFNSNAETVDRARQLFAQAGQINNWRAGTRAFLEDALRASKGDRTSSTFANKVAPLSPQWESLRAALPEAEQNNMAQILNTARAQGRVPHPRAKVSEEPVRLEEQQIGTTPLRSTIRAAISPFRWVKELGDEMVNRPFSWKASDMAQKLTSGTDNVLANLEATAQEPFGGWQRHLLEQALAAGTQGAIGQGRATGLLDDTQETKPTDPRLRRIPGLLSIPGGP
jgi:hypothetical protein